MSILSILLYNSYLVKWSTKEGEGVKKVQKSVHMIYGRPLMPNRQGREQVENMSYFV